MTPPFIGVHDATAPRRRRHLTTTALLVAGAAALAWTSGIHLRLWSEGYDHIPTIGPLFLMQGIVASLLALLVLGVAVSGAVRTPTGTRETFVTAALSAGAALFLVATIGGLLMSDWFGLFGLHDHLNSPFAGLSLVVEAVGTVVMLTAAARVLWEADALHWRRHPPPN